MHDPRALVVSPVSKFEKQKLCAGIDQGGLLKELLELILEKAFDGDLGLVQFTADGKAFPSPQAQCVPDGLSLLEFVGMSVGKALYVPFISTLCFHITCSRVHALHCSILLSDCCKAWCRQLIKSAHQECAQKSIIHTHVNLLGVCGPEAIG